MIKMNLSSLLVVYQMTLQPHNPANILQWIVDKAVRQSLHVWSAGPLCSIYLSLWKEKKISKYLS